MSRTPPARIWPTASLPLMPTVPMEPSEPTYGHAAAVALDERGHAGTGRGDQSLRAEVLLGVAAPLRR